MSELPEQELTKLEASLAALRPQAGGFNRDRLLFCAGQASVSRRGWGWPAATTCLALATISLALTLWLQPVPEPSVRIVYLPAPPAEAPAPPRPGPEDEASPAPPTPRPPELAYLRLREQVLRFGLDGLPPLLPLPPAEVAEPLSVKGLLELR